MEDPSVMQKRECGGPRSPLSAFFLWPQHQCTPFMGDRRFLLQEFRGAQERTGRLL